MIENIKKICVFVATQQSKKHQSSYVNIDELIKSYVMPHYGTVTETILLS